MASLKSASHLQGQVGRTVPPFRMGAEIERTKWKQFRSYLDKKDRKMFDQKSKLAAVFYSNPHYLSLVSCNRNLFLAGNSLDELWIQ